MPFNKDKFILPSSFVIYLSFTWEVFLLYILISVCSDPHNVDFPQFLTIMARKFRQKQVEEDMNELREAFRVILSLCYFYKHL